MSLPTIIILLSAFATAKQPITTTFIIPCEKNISIDKNAKLDFSETWGRGETNLHNFKILVANKIKSDLASSFPSSRIFDDSSYCNDTTLETRIAVIDSNRSSSFKIPHIDTLDGIYVFITNINFSIDAEFKEPSTVVMPTGHSTLVTNTGLSYKKSVCVTYDIIIHDATKNEIVLAISDRSTSSWPIIKTLTKGNWTGATGFMINKTKDATKRSQ